MPKYYEKGTVEYNEKIASIAVLMIPKDAEVKEKNQRQEHLQELADKCIECLVKGLSQSDAELELEEFESLGSSIDLGSIKKYYTFIQKLYNDPLLMNGACIWYENQHTLFSNIVYNVKFAKDSFNFRVVPNDEDLYREVFLADTPVDDGLTIQEDSDLENSIINSLASDKELPFRTKMSYRKIGPVGELDKDKDKNEESMRTLTERTNFYLNARRKLKSLEGSGHSDEWKAMSGVLAALDDLQFTTDTYDENYFIRLKSLSDLLLITSRDYISHKVNKPGFSKRMDLERLKMANEFVNFARRELQQINLWMENHVSKEKNNVKDINPLLKNDKQLRDELIFGVPEGVDVAKTDADMGIAYQLNDDALADQRLWLNELRKELNDISKEAHGASDEYGEMAHALSDLIDYIDYYRLQEQNETSVAGKKSKEAVLHERLKKINELNNMYKNALNKADAYLEHKKVSNNGGKVSIRRMEAAMRMKHFLDNSSRALTENANAIYAIREKEKKALNDSYDRNVKTFEQNIMKSRNNIVNSMKERKTVDSEDLYRSYLGHLYTCAMKKEEKDRTRFEQNMILAIRKGTIGDTYKKIKSGDEFLRIIFLPGNVHHAVTDMLKQEKGFETLFSVIDTHFSNKKNSPTMDTLQKVFGPKNAEEMLYNMNFRNYINYLGKLEKSITQMKGPELRENFLSMYAGHYYKTIMETKPEERTALDKEFLNSVNKILKNHWDVNLLASHIRSRAEYEVLSKMNLQDLSDNFPSFTADFKVPEFLGNDHGVTHFNKVTDLVHRGAKVQLFNNAQKDVAGMLLTTINNSKDIAPVEDNREVLKRKALTAYAVSRYTLMISLAQKNPDSEDAKRAESIIPEVQKKGFTYYEENLRIGEPECADYIDSLTTQQIYEKLKSTETVHEMVDNVNQLRVRKNSVKTAENVKVKENERRKEIKEPAVEKNI